MMAATAAATIAAMVLTARATRDGRIGDAALCLVLTLAGFVLGGAA